MKKIIFISFFLLTIILVSANNAVFCEIHYASDIYNAENIPKNKIIVYPNPWIPEYGVSESEIPDMKNTIKHGHLSAEGWIKFAGMQKETGTLKIYDVTGNLVKNFRWNATKELTNFPVEHFEFSIRRNDGTIDYYESQEYSDTKNNETPNYNIIHWDGKDNNFEYVKSGVYIWILSEDGGFTHHGKIVIVR